MSEGRALQRSPEGMSVSDQRRDRGGPLVIFPPEQLRLWPLAVWMEPDPAFVPFHFHPLLTGQRGVISKDWPGLPEVRSLLPLSFENSEPNLSILSLTRTFVIALGGKLNI